MTTLIQFVVTIFGTWRQLSEEVHSNHRFAQRLLWESGSWEMPRVSSQRAIKRIKAFFFRSVDSDWTVTGQFQETVHPGAKQGRPGASCKDRIR